MCKTVFRWLCVIGLFGACDAFAAPGDLLFKLTAPDPQGGAAFGDLISAVDGDILVSEPSRQYLPIDALGRAYLFDTRTGALKWTFNNPDPTNLDVFSRAVAGGNGRVFISTSGLEDRVYAYSATSGELLHTIYEPDRPPSSSFGTGLAYRDGRLLVSNPSFSVDAQLFAVGRAYVFNGESGDLQRTFPNPEPARQETFGVGLSVSLVGNRVVVGSIADNSFDGRVWILDGSTGQSLATLDNPNAERPEPQFLPDWFGWSVAADETIVVVGAQEDDTAGLDGSGTVYVFDIQTGALKHTLFSPQLELNGEFGRSVAITPNGDVLVGAWNTSVSGSTSVGHAYLFDGQSGNLLLDISNPNPDFAVFGWSVAAAGERILVSSPAEGAVYVFEGVPEPSALILAVVVIVIAFAIKIRTAANNKGVLERRHRHPTER